MMPRPSESRPFWIQTEVHVQYSEATCGRSFAVYAVYTYGRRPSLDLCAAPCVEIVYLAVACCVSERCHVCVSYSFEVLLVTPRCDYAVCAQVCMRVSSCLWGVDSHVCMRASSFVHVCVFLYVIVFLHRRASNSPFILSKLKLHLFAAMNVYTSLCEAARVYTSGAAQGARWTHLFRS